MAKVVNNNTSAANTLNAEEKFRLFLAGEEVEWEYSMLPLAISEFGEDEPVYDGLICPECGRTWSDYKSHSSFNSLYEGEHIVLDDDVILLIYEEEECPHCRCRALMEEITRMALAQPEHRVVPYANLPKRLYPKSHPLEVYDEEAR